jgi:hypothetical protein
MASCGFARGFFEDSFSSTTDEGRFMCRISITANGFRQPIARWISNKDIEPGSLSTQAAPTCRFRSSRDGTWLPKNFIITAFFRNQPFDSGSSAINHLARSARALASFASYADQLLSNTEIVSQGPEDAATLVKPKPGEK